MKRICTSCDEEKDIERFVKQKGKYRTDNYRRTCKECKNKKRRTGLKIGFVKGHIPWNKGKKGIGSGNKGKKRTAEQIEKTVSRLRGKGKGRWTYNYHQWRNKVFERDGNKCTTCSSEKRLHCHHKIPWKNDENLRFAVDNGITLCISCHMRLEGFQKGHPAHENGIKALQEYRKRKGSWNKGFFNSWDVKRICMKCLEEKKIEDFRMKKRPETVCKKCNSKRTMERKKERDSLKYDNKTN